jgi:hypothetical protein
MIVTDSKERERERERYYAQPIPHFTGISGSDKMGLK